jgi:hypothetical protein
MNEKTATACIADNAGLVRDRILAGKLPRKYAQAE